MIKKLEYIKGPKPKKSIISGGVLDHKQRINGSILVDDYSFTVDPILNNNPWWVIKMVCEDGLASNYWAVGDAKKVVGGDTYERYVKIVDMTGLYNKHVVFQFFNTSLEYVSWNSSANKDDDECSNNYSIADVRSQFVVGEGTELSKMCSQELSSLLTNTTVKVAKNGKSDIILEVTDKSFFPAERELWTTRYYSVEEEFDALSTFSYWQTNTANADHIIKLPQSVDARAYWNRSPYSGEATIVCYVHSNGSATSYFVGPYNNCVLCFSF